MSTSRFPIEPQERSPGQDGDIFTGNVLDQRHGGPVTIGFGRYGPNQILERPWPFTTPW
jgi:ethanolamine utilization protein EutQ (cupin superfamily)